MDSDDIKSTIEIITPLSEKERSGIYLATLPDTTLVVYKEYKDDRGALVQRIRQLNLDCIPRILALECTNTKTSLLEEYIEGEDLLTYCQKGCTPSDTFHLIYQLLMALQKLHSLIPPIIHRDIKPENILITADNRLFLIDFDAAREYSETERENDTILLGTKGYAAPEQYGFSQTDVRTDIYSVGVVCNLLIEHTSFTSTTKHRLQKIMDKATMFDPDKRYQTVTEMLSDLSKVTHKHFHFFIMISLLCLISLVLIFFWRTYPKSMPSPVNQAITTSNQDDNNSYIDWDILPSDFHLSPIQEAATKEEQKRNAYRNNNQTVFHYYKTVPQALLFYDFHVENQGIRDVTLQQYDSTGTQIVEQIRILNMEHYSIKNGCICLSSALFDSLSQGAYCLNIIYSDGTCRSRPVYIHDAVDSSHTPAPYLEEPVKYYNPTVNNEMLFNVLGTPYTIKSIEADGTLLSNDQYRLTLDNRGVLISAPYSRIKLTLTNGQTVSGKIYVIEG